MNNFVGNATVFKYEFDAKKVSIVFLQDGDIIFEEKLTPAEDFYGNMIHEATIVSPLKKFTIYSNFNFSQQN